MKHKIKFRILFVLAVFLLVGCVKQNDKVNAEETIMKEDNAYETTFEEMQEYKMVSETNPVEKGTKTVNDLIAENNEKKLGNDGTNEKQGETIPDEQSETTVEENNNFILDETADIEETVPVPENVDALPNGVDNTSDQEM